MTSVADDVLVAVVGAMEPVGVLADEPTGNLDSRTGREVVRLLMDLNDDGQTIVLVTHDVKVAGVADRLLLMRDGRVHERSTDEDGEQDPVVGLARLVDADDPSELSW